MNPSPEPPPERWAWKLRLFLSADLAGSTAYKISHAEEPFQWAETFRSFFGDFPRFLKSEYRKLANGEDAVAKLPLCSEELKPWKFSGDEILFTARLSDHTHAVTHIAAFRNAVANYPKEWKEKKLPLRLKGSGWLAGFPVTNTELDLRAEKNTLLQDFIGPSIDLGFRVASQATPRKFMLTIDLALMLLDAIDNLELGKDFFEFRFDGRKELKGVLQGNPYPLVWIDGAERNSLDRLEDSVAKVNQIEPGGLQNSLKDYLRAFIDEHTPSLFRPFIENDPDPRYRKINQIIAERREKLIRLATESGYIQMGVETDPPEADQPKDAKLDPPKTKQDIPPNPHTDLDAPIESNENQ